MKTASLGLGLDIDVAQLIKSRLLIQANSGGGKSWTLRRLCEQTFGMVQHIIIDPEGEFYTLREKYDYAVFGKGGDGPADLKSAPLLARRLLELGLSAIIDISELGVRRPAFVKAFLEALVAAPRALWHPVLVVLDEAHSFCPEKGRGESASTAAVIDLMTVGRKRGFCGVLATQRVSKLNKDAAAECNNKLIGRCSLDVDRKRAGEELGFSEKNDVLSLRELEAGEFYAWGPALCTTIKKMKVGKVQTTHPEAGEVAPPPVPPRAKVKKLLDELSNLPHEAAEEAKTVAELQAEVRRLSLELKKKPSEKPAKTETVKEVVPVVTPKMLARVERLASRLTGDTDRLTKQIEKIDSARDRLAQAQQALVSEVDNMRREVRIRAGVDTPKNPDTLPTELRAVAAQMAAQQRSKIGEPAIGAQKHPPVHKLLTPRPAPAAADGDTTLDGPMKRILGALAWFEAMGIDQPSLTAVAFMSDYSGADNGAFNNARGRLRSAGYVDYPGPGLTVLTAAGRAAAPAVNTPKTAEAVRDAVMAKLDGPGRRIMQSLLEAYPNEVLGDDLATAAGYSGADNGAFNNARGRLRTLGVATYPRSGAVRAADILFPS